MRRLFLQIDTWNRDNNSSKFKAGPLPKAATSPPDAVYSGLIECPCTDRIFKHINIEYSSRVYSYCDQRVHTAQECFQSASSLLAGVTKIISNLTVFNSSLPTGCSFQSSNQSTAVAIFNSYSSNISCGSGKLVGGKVIETITGISLEILLDNDMVEFTLSGPSTVWFGVGFNASQMVNLPYAIIVTGSNDTASSSVFEQLLADHEPGTALSSSITLVSSSVLSGVRTVVFRRKAVGLTQHHFTFDPANYASINMIFATGTTSNFQYHGPKHAQRQITMFNKAPGQFSCVCTTGLTGEICGHSAGCNGIAGVHFL